MVERKLSPDGKSEWTGSEWVPVGTEVHHAAGANVYTQQKIVDSVIMGNLTSQTIVQNSPEDMAKAMVLALEQIGFVGNIQTTNPSNNQMSNVQNLLKAGDELNSRGVKIQGSTDLKLGNAARLTGRYQGAMEYYQRALKTFRAESNRSGVADALINIGYLALNQGDVSEAYTNFRDARAMKLELGEKNGE
ncbi:MAG: tetratricopeptide repeat protein, partial [Euryarchaeota archaeon]|nr:tetratricopeptide repeat protein [Euryarchaeota archaeon]